MPNYISAIKLPSGDVYQIKDSGALRLTGGQVTGPVNFGDSVYISDLNAGALIVTGNAAFTNNIQANTINGVEVGPNPKFTDTTYTFDGIYNASSNKVATVQTITDAINALDVAAKTGTTSQTITSISQTNGKIDATYSNISITKSQISDFPSSMAPTAHTHAYIVTEGDNRSVATTPDDYTSTNGRPNRIVFRGLKANSYINSPSSDTYSYLVGLRGWSDNSGGNAYEIAFNNTGIFVRKGATTTWDNWERLYTSGNLTKTRIANTYYGVSFGRTGGIPVETILYTGIKWISSKHMPIVHITGYAYGLHSPVEFKIGFYIYQNKIGYCGVTNMGAWQPQVYLFKYTQDSIDYVAVGLAGSCYYLQLCVDIQDEMGKFTGIDVDEEKWSWSFLTTAGTIPDPDGGTTCIQVPYKANILKPANATHADTATKATQDADGNVIKNTYLKLSGGTMTGGITFGNDSSAWNTKGVLFSKGSRIGENTSGGLGIYSYQILYLRPSATSGSGSEGIEISSDGLYPTNNGTESLGKTNNKWSSVYATTFVGDLNGSAKKLSQVDNITSLNDFIDSTYLTYIAKGGSNTVANKPSGVDAFGALSLKTAQGYQGQLLISSNNSSGLYWRTGIISSNAISANWLKVLDSNNYTDYTVTKSGTGANGTWGINISGTAAVASEISAITSSDNASDSDVWRNVWISYSNNTKGRPAVSSFLAYQTSTKTLKASHFLAEHISGGGKEFQVKSSTVDMALMIGSGNQNHGLYDYIANKWMIFADKNGNVTVNGNATSATTASKLGSSNVGAIDRPIYLSAGTATQTTYRMAATNAAATTARAITDDLETGIWYVNGTNSTDLYSINDGVAYVNKYNDNWIHEIYGDYRTGQIAVRGKNNGTWQSWRKILDSSNYINYMGDYVTLTTEQTISGHKTFSDLVTLKNGTGSEYCNINYNQTLGALVFSFG